MLLLVLLHRPTRTGECTCTGWPDNCFDEPKINPKVATFCKAAITCSLCVTILGCCRHMPWPAVLAFDL